MIINQVGGGGKPEEMDSYLDYLGNTLVALFSESNSSAAFASYTGSFNGTRLNMNTNACGLKGDRHIFQAYKDNGISTTNTGYGPRTGVYLTTPLSTSSVLAGEQLFTKSVIGEKKGSGRMFVFFARGSVIVSPKPVDATYGVFRDFTFDYTNGKNEFKVEDDYVDASDVRTTISTGYLSAVMGYIMYVTFE